MSKARLIITAVVLEGRSQTAVARDYGVSKGWVSKLVARYRAEGETAFDPKSRRPNSSPNAIPVTTVEMIIVLRRQLAVQGLDAGPDTDRLAPRPTPRHDRVTGHHQPLPHPRRPGHT